MGGRRGRRSGNLPPNAPAGTPPLAPLRSFSSPNCCYGCLLITLRTQSRLLVSHLAPPCQPPPSSAFPVPELSEVMAAEGLCVGCSSTQTPVLCSEDSLLQPSRAFSAGPAPLHLSSDIYLPDPQSEEAPSQRSETWADLEF